MTDSTTQTTKLLVVIINYFSATLVESLIEQLIKQNLPDYVSISIVCSDNSTSKDQQAALRHLKASTSIELDLVLNSQNLGFGNAINHCVEGQEFDFLCCINPDVTLFPETIPNILKHALKHPNQGLWGGLTVDDQQQPDFRHAWQEPSLKNTLSWAVGLKHLSNRPNWQDNYAHMGGRPIQAYSVDCVSGCCLLMSNSAWLAVGGFDDDFFLYSEEVDLCLRARQSGFQPTVIPSAKLTHSSHSQDESAHRLPMIYSSKFLYASKHHGLTYNIFYRMLVAFGAFIRTVKYSIHGHFNTAKAWGTLMLNSLFYKPRS